MRLPICLPSPTVIREAFRSSNGGAFSRRRCDAPNNKVRVLPSRSPTANGHGVSTTTVQPALSWLA